MIPMRNWIPQVFGASMLLWALAPGNPYAYYTLPRWVCCAIFAYLPVRLSQVRATGWVWIAGGTKREAAHDYEILQQYVGHSPKTTLGAHYDRIDIERLRAIAELAQG